MKLPLARTEGTFALEKAIAQRRTVRAFQPKALALDQLSQLLWAAQGVTGAGFKRTAPSAGALFPMDVYAVAGRESVERMPAGIYLYRPQEHALLPIAVQDLRESVAAACLGQSWMSQAPLQLVITAEYGRVAGKYGQRGRRYAHMEAGHIAQNIFLQAEALGLKAGIVGAFNDEEVKKVMGVPGAHEPMLIMPVGYGSK